MSAVDIENWRDDFDLIILDVWGVLSDGQVLFESSLPFLQSLQAIKLNTALISNTPFRSFDLQMRLEKMGLGALYYNALITAGDVSRVLLHKKSMPWKGNAYYYIGPDETSALLDELNFHRVGDIGKADFLLITGYPDNIPSLEKTRETLMEALRCKLPALCPNPDKSFAMKDKKIICCAGKIASQYELLGGTVFYVGKPFSAIYHYALSQFSITSPGRVLAIGDSLETDIAGAKRMGFKSLLVTSEKKNAANENLIHPDWQVGSLGECLKGLVA